MLGNNGNDLHRINLDAGHNMAREIVESISDYSTLVQSIIGHSGLSFPAPEQFTVVFQGSCGVVRAMLFPRYFDDDDAE